MLRRILLGVLLLLLLTVALAGGALFVAHRATDAERAPLPSVDDLERLEAAPANDLPVRLWWVDTASQAMPRGAVLDPGGDPAPDEPYVMSHPSFVLEWADGRILLVDAGMRPASAVDFGGVIETLGGAAPIVPHGSVAETLGDARGRVAGLVFTHLHTDHVDGVLELCEGRSDAITAFMTEAQAERPNYTTRPGLALLDEAGCVRRERLPRSGTGALLEVPGFPGVVVVAAGGHTPGSQIVLARVGAPDGERRYAFTGDIANAIDGIRHDVAKPFLYRTVMVPESEERQGELRRFLAALERERGYTLLVSHDERSLEAALGPARASAPAPAR